MLYGEAFGTPQDKARSARNAIINDLFCKALDIPPGERLTFNLRGVAFILKERHLYLNVSSPKGLV